MLDFGYFIPNLLTRTREIISCSRSTTHLSYLVLHAIHLITCVNEWEPCQTIKCMCNSKNKTPSIHQRLVAMAPANIYRLSALVWLQPGSSVGPGVTAAWFILPQPMRKFKFTLVSTMMPGVPLPSPGAPLDGGWCPVAHWFSYWVDLNLPPK